MDSKTIQMPREVHIGPNVLDDIGEICKNLRLFDEALVVSGYHTFDVAGKLTLAGDYCMLTTENTSFGISKKIKGSDHLHMSQFFRAYIC